MGDYFYSILPTSDGGFIAAGETRSFGAGWNDGWLVRTNDAGIELWSRTFGGGNEDYFSSILPTSDGGFIAAGATRSLGAGWNDGWLVRTNDAGIELWSRTFGGGYDDAFSSIQPTDDGGFIAAGYRRFSWDGDWDAWLVRTAGAGIELWSRTFGGGNDDSFSSIQPTSDGGFIAAGKTSSFGARNEGGWLVRTNDAGIRQWGIIFDGGRDDSFSSIQPTSDGGFIVAGRTWSSGAGGADGWLVKVCEE